MSLFSLKGCRRESISISKNNIYSVTINICQKCGNTLKNINRSGLIFKIVLITSLIALVCGCGSNDKKNDSSLASTNDFGAFTTSKIIKTYTEQVYETGNAEVYETSFDEADIISFVPRIGEKYGNALVVYLDAKNNSNEIVKSVYAYVSVCDNAGVEIGYGPVPGMYGIEPNKTIEMMQSVRADSDYADIVVVTAYDYSTENGYYHIDIQNKNAVTWNINDNGLDFEEYNILSFDFVPEGIDSTGNYRVKIIISNNSDIDIKDARGNIVGLNDNNDFIASTAGYFGALSPRDVNEAECSFLKDNNVNFSNITQIGITKYRYWYEDDGKGYEIDLLNMTVNELE